MSQRPVTSSRGTISVVTTERGLPVSLRLDASELSKPPHQLARDIMALCRVSAARRQAARRRELSEKGFSATVIRGLHLATDSDVAAAEAEAFGDADDDDAPPSWLKRLS